MASGHAPTAIFLEERLGWIDSDECWWCHGGRKTREHLFKECTIWKKEIRQFWEDIARAAGTREAPARLEDQERIRISYQAGGHQA